MKHEEGKGGIRVTWELRGRSSGTLSSSQWLRGSLKVVMRPKGILSTYLTPRLPTVCGRGLSMPSYTPFDFSSTDMLVKKTHTHTPACSRPEEGEREDDKGSSTRS